MKAVLLAFPKGGSVGPGRTMVAFVDGNDKVFEVLHGVAGGQKVVPDQPGSTGRVTIGDTGRLVVENQATWQMLATDIEHAGIRARVCYNERPGHEDDLRGLAG